VWVLLPILPAKSNHLIPILSEMITTVENQKSGDGCRRQLHHLDELIRLVGAITPMPFG